MTDRQAEQSAGPPPGTNLLALSSNPTAVVQDAAHPAVVGALFLVAATTAILPALLRPAGQGLRHE